MIDPNEGRNIFSRSTPMKFVDARIHYRKKSEVTIVSQEVHYILIACNLIYSPEAVFPHSLSTPCTAAAMASPFSAAFSILAIASYKHLVISRSAITSPFSTTGRCRNLPGNLKTENLQQVLYVAENESCLNCISPWTIFCNASTANVSLVTNSGFLVMTLETMVSSGFNPSAMTLVTKSCIISTMVTAGSQREHNSWIGVINTLSVIIPLNNALASVRSAASTRRVSIRRQASSTVVPSGMVKAFDSFNLPTVRSPDSDL